jgi:hypothetical protein
MIGWPARHLRLDAAKAKVGQIKLIDKNIDRPDRIVLAQLVIQPLGKQFALTAVIANDKASHRILRPNRKRIDGVFTQSGSKANFSGQSASGAKRTLAAVDKKARSPRARIRE